MKKLFVAMFAACAMAFTFTSCNPNGVQCWKIFVEFSNGTSATYYFWGDGEQADLQIENYAKLPGVSKTGRTQTFLSESDCQALIIK